MSTWDSAQPPPSLSLTTTERWRAIGRFSVLALGLVIALPVLLLARAIESISHAGARRFSPYVVQAYSSFLLRVIGLPIALRGTLVRGHAAWVANHGSWLDIFVLSAIAPALFVAKSEVAAWPGIGPLARMAGTVFIRRDRRDATAQTHVLAAEFRHGHGLVFFPEGTSTDSTLVLPFKPTLFQAFLAPDMPRNMQVQPVTLRYHAPLKADPRFYGWWGGMDFTSHFLRILGQGGQGRVTIILHPPIACTPDQGRKVLAARAEAAVRTGFAAA